MFLHAEKRSNNNQNSNIDSMNKKNMNNKDNNRSNIHTSTSNINSTMNKKRRQKKDGRVELTDEDLETYDVRDFYRDDGIIVNHLPSFSDVISVEWRTGYS